MRLRNSPKTYGSIAIGLHWIVAVLVPAAWISGHLGDMLPRPSHDMGLFMHTSLGLSMLGFALARLAWRLADPPPVPAAIDAAKLKLGPVDPQRLHRNALVRAALDTKLARALGLGRQPADALQPQRTAPKRRADSAAWTVQAGEIVHLLIYGVMLAIPVLGIITQFARGYPLPVFGLFDIASPWAGDRGFAHDMKDVHEALANGLMLLIGLHAGAALLHHYWLHDRTLQRMLPGLR